MRCLWGSHHVETADRNRAGWKIGTGHYPVTVHMLTTVTVAFSRYLLYNRQQSLRWKGEAVRVQNIGFPTIDPVATGKNITRLRKQCGLTVHDLQEYFGFDAPQAIYKWQKGATLPSLDNFYALSALLGRPMEEILVPHGASGKRQQSNGCCQPVCGSTQPPISADIIRFIPRDDLCIPIRIQTVLPHSDESPALKYTDLLFSDAWNAS